MSAVANTYWIADENGILPTGVDVSSVVDADDEPLLHIYTAIDGIITWAQSPNKALMIAKNNPLKAIITCEYRNSGGNGTTQFTGKEFFDFVTNVCFVKEEYRIAERFC